jgi:hypothetical protein
MNSGEKYIYLGQERKKFTLRQSSIQHAPNVEHMDTWQGIVLRYAYNSLMTIFEKLLS